MNPLTILLILGLLALLFGYGSLQRRYVRLKREQYIRSYVFPASLLTKLNKNHGHLTEKDHFLVARALREFFLIKARAGSSYIGMPSKVVDDLWHEFILDTRAYSHFCKHALGAFFHHVPASATPKGTDINELLRVTWKHACLEENINPSRATRLPLLFAIDEKLKIENGNRYNTWNMAKADSNSSSCGGSACSGGESSCDSGGGNSGCGGGCGGD